MPSKNDRFYKIEELDIEKDKQNQRFNPIIFIVISMISVIYLIYMVVLFAVPRKRYNNAKNEYKIVKSPSSAIIIIHFLFHISVTVTFFSLTFFIYECVKKYDTNRMFHLLNFVLSIVFSTFAVLFWIIGLIFGLTLTINPGKVLSPNELNKTITNTNTKHLITYAYGEILELQNNVSTTNIYDIKTRFNRRYKSTTPKYSQPYIIKMNITDFQYDEFDETKYPDIYGLELNISNNFDEKIKYYINISCNEVREAMTSNGYEMTDCIIGIYPDFQGINYVSKTGKYKGKYSQSARIAAAFFGVGTYYDHTTSSIPYYSLNINRTFEYYDPSEPPLIDPSTFLDISPNIGDFYNKIFA